MSMSILFINNKSLIILIIHNTVVLYEIHQKHDPLNHWIGEESLFIFSLKTLLKKRFGNAITINKYYNLQNQGCI